MFHTPSSLALYTPREILGKETFLTISMAPPLPDSKPHGEDLGPSHGSALWFGCLLDAEEGECKALKVWLLSITATHQQNVI